MNKKTSIASTGLCVEAFVLFYNRKRSSHILSCSYREYVWVHIREL